MSNITAVKSTNDGRQWFIVTFAEDEFGQESGAHEYAIADDGALLNSDGTPVDYNEYLRNAVLSAIGQ
jgi:hypothetical protein